VSSAAGPLTATVRRSLRPPAAVLALIAWSVGASAAAQPPISAPPPAGAAPPSASAGGPLEMSIGFGTVVGPRPYLGASPTIIPIPVINLRYKRVFVEGTRGGIQFLRAGALTGTAHLQANFEGLESDHSPRLDGMSDRQMSADGGIEIAWRARPVGARVAFLSDVLGRNGGQEISVQATTGAPLGRQGFLLVGIGPRWLSGNRVDYAYGVRPEEARPGRPAYAGSSTWNWDLSIGAPYRPQPRWTWFVLVNREGFGNSIRQSPIVGRGSSYTAVAYVSYRVR